MIDEEEFSVRLGDATVYTNQAPLAARVGREGRDDDNSGPTLTSY
jgi:hypothetical protein